MCICICIHVYMLIFVLSDCWMGWSRKSHDAPMPLCWRKHLAGSNTINRENRFLTSPPLFQCFVLHSLLASSAIAYSILLSSLPGLAHFRLLINHNIHKLSSVGSRVKDGSAVNFAEIPGSNSSITHTISMQCGWYPWKSLIPHVEH